MSHVAQYCGWVLSLDIEMSHYAQDRRREDYFMSQLHVILTIFIFIYIIVYIYTRTYMYVSICPKIQQRQTGVTPLLPSY